MHQTLKSNKNFDVESILQVLGSLLSTAENLASKASALSGGAAGRASLNYNLERKYYYYDSFNSFGKKSINSLIPQFIFQIDIFESAYNMYCQKYGKFDFPHNLSKEKIISDLQEWMKIVEEKYKKYYLAIINILNNKHNYISESHFGDLIRLYEKEKEEKERKEKEKKEKEKEEKERKEKEKKEKEKEEKEKKRYKCLYRALHENRSNRTSNLYDAYYATDFNDELDSSIYNLYQKSINITNLENDKNSRQNDVNNLNYKLSSINNSITNTQDLIKNKNNIIAIKKNNIKQVLDKINGLADLLNDKNKQADIKVNDIIDNENNKIKNLDETLKAKNEFIKEIKDLENQKEENIKNMKKNNEILKQKNANFIQMLSALEEKIKN